MTKNLEFSATGTKTIRKAGSLETENKAMDCL